MKSVKCDVCRNRMKSRVTVLQMMTIMVQQKHAYLTVCCCVTLRSAVLESFFISLLVHRLCLNLQIITVD